MRTPFGRHVYATGGNAEAAWLAGIRVHRVLLAVYALCGLCAGLAGVLVASRLNAGYPKAGEFYELDAVTAVVVGGTSLFGGRGSIWGTLAGAFFIGILNNGLNLFHVETYDQLDGQGRRAAGRGLSRPLAYGSCLRTLLAGGQESRPSSSSDASSSAASR